jgi:flagellar biosynthesis component FlhA
MYWQRIVLAVAIIALSLTMFVPMPVWAAVTLMVIALISAVLVVVGLLRSRR